MLIMKITCEKGVSYVAKSPLYVYPIVDKDVVDAFNWWKRDPFTMSSALSRFLNSIPLLLFP